MSPSEAETSQSSSPTIGRAPSQAEAWIAAYEDGHTQLGNRILHWICTPFLILGISGLLWALPVPEPMRGAAPILNWGTLFLMAAVVYYFIMSIYLAIGILPFIVAVFAAVAWLDQQPTPLWMSSGVIFIGASLGQIAGHLFEGGRASLIRDLHYAAIAPLWVLACVYRKLGIPF